MTHTAYVALVDDGRCPAELWLPPDERVGSRGDFVDCGRPAGHAGDHVAAAPIGRSLRRGGPQRIVWADGTPRDEAPS